MRGKRYLVFEYYQYYPCGGMDDCVYKTNCLETAIRFMIEKKIEDDSYVYDVVNGKTYTHLSRR